MAERYVGLDIGSFAVRAAEVSGDPGSLTLHRFGQVTLPPGAVVDGEIVDGQAVTAAVRSLWDNGGFKSKKVVVGIANKWVKVRQAEVPALSPEDVRNSLRYEAQEVIPFADEDAIVDFVVQDRVSGPDGDSLRILVVAAQRQMVSTVLDTVRRAGLTVQLVDLTPFALVRSLTPHAAPGVSEAIVSIGAGLTNVVVHTGGTPRLVRMTPKAGAALTENLTRALGVDFERAEALKRGAGVAVADPHTAQAADIIASELTPLVQEIQGSLDYFLAQTDDVELRRVLLTGAGAKMAGLRNRLATELRVPVEMASPLEYLRIGRTGLSDEQLTNAAAVMAAPVGLAMAPLATPATKLVSLFPAEHRKADTDRSLKVAAGAGVAAFAMLLGGLWVVRQAEVTSTRSDVRGATTRADQLQRQVTALAPFELAERTVLARQAEAQAVLATDVDVVDILDRFTAALPGDVAATNITVSTASPGGAAGQAAATAGGTITIAGVATDINGASHWITAMRQLDIFTGVWVPSDSRGGTGTAGATFAGNLDLTPKARSNRAEQFKADLP